MLQREAERPSKQNILIADTILAEQRPQLCLKAWGTIYIFRGKDFCFYHMFTTNFSEHNKIWGHKKDLGVTASE